MKAKIISLIVIVVVLIIFISQNTALVEINFLFWTFSMSGIILILLTSLLGIIVGFILGRLSFDNSKK